MISQVIQKQLEAAKQKKNGMERHGTDPHMFTLQKIYKPYLPLPYQHILAS